MTEIEKIKTTKKFKHGIPIKWHKIDSYKILEYHPWKIDGCVILEGIPDSKRIYYHGWIDGKNLHESWPSIEIALASMMALKWSGKNNGNVGYLFCKMINTPPYNKESNGYQLAIYELTRQCLKK